MRGQKKQPMTDDRMDVTKRMSPERLRGRRRKRATPTRERDLAALCVLALPRQYTARCWYAPIPWRAIAAEHIHAWHRTSRIRETRRETRP